LMQQQVCRLASRTRPSVNDFLCKSSAASSYNVVLDCSNQRISGGSPLEYVLGKQYHFSV
jgi:hypothetical protein